MDFKRITIPYAGRDKYPGNNGGQSVKSLITTYLSGIGGSSGGYENRGGNSQGFFAFLSKTSGTYSITDLEQAPITELVTISGYKNQSIAQTLVGDITESAATASFDILGIPDSGLTVNVYNNGTSASTLAFTFDSTILTTGEDSGTLTIPVAVNINDNELDPYHEVWYANQNKCVQINLQFTWTISRASTTNYTLDLSNQTAQVNCDSAGTLYPNSIATLECTATTYYNGQPDSSVTYSVSTSPNYMATGFSINQNTGVLTFNSAGTVFYWSPAYPALPITVTATKDGLPVGQKTMTISRNYPGADGTPAHTRYINTSASYIAYDPNTSAYTPSSVVGQVWLQVGDELPVPDTATTIYQWYDNLETGKTSAQGSITANVYTGVEVINFGLQNSNNQYYELEDVPVVTMGKDGEPGASGATGPSGESAWYLTLSNDNSTINCDVSGNVLAGAVRPETCVCKLYHGITQITGNSVDYVRSANTSYTGISFQNVNGTLSVVFNSTFTFSGAVLNITLSAKTDNTVRDVKVLTVTKCFAGEDGTPGVSYWLQFNATSVIFNPNNNTRTPDGITVNAFKQYGDGAVIPLGRNLIGELIRYCWVYPDGTNTSWLVVPSSSGTPISIDVTAATTYSKIRFQIYADGAIRDTEDIDIIREGLDGGSGQSRKGAAIRGPYDYAHLSASTQCWCAGESSSTCSDCDKWIDVILKDGVYYYCNTTYYGSLSPWNSYKDYWTSGDSFDFVATRLLLAQNASIDFLTNNEIYLRDSNNQITAGAAGGNGINFWAGSDSPSNAPFQVDNEGNITAKKGTFAGYIQYPYTFVCDLEYNQTSNYYIADDHAYLVSDSHNESSRVGVPAYLQLPTPSASLNGFTYQIIIEPSSGRSSTSRLHISTNSVSPSYGSAIYVYAFSEPRAGKDLLLDSGNYKITCIPRHTGSTTSITYSWVITEATGAVEIVTGDGATYNTQQWISMPMSVFYGSDITNNINKMVAYTGTTKPTVLNSGSTMFIRR